MGGGLRFGVVACSIALTATLAGACGESTLGASGESCGAREDCQEDLVCIQQTCTAGGPASGSGQLGETCAAPTDCAPGLACVAGVCIRESSNLSPTGKDCYAVECEAKDDCCGSFVPSPNCPTYQQQCMTEPTACGTYHLLCECNRDCDETGRCADTPLQCVSSDECASFTAPFCVGGACHACAAATDCAGEAALCVDGECVEPCVSDEACPLFFACQGGSCVDVGCQTDRECVFDVADDRATCRDGTCGVPCEADWQCAPEPGVLSLDVCLGGVCTFVGCETDAECRVYLGIESEATTVRAVCK